MDPNVNNSPSDSSKALIRIGSININGINKKLNSIHYIIQKSKLQLLCIQQIYNYEKTKLEKWLAKNDYSIFVNKDVSKAQKTKNYCHGTAMIFKNTLKQQFNIQNKIIEDNRIQMATLENKNIAIDIYNCYFPQTVKERYQIITKLDTALTERNEKFVLMAGDYNFVEDPLDTRNQHLFRNTKDKKRFKLLRENQNLRDLYRENNDLKQIFTFANAVAATRIDRIYVNENLTSLTKNIDYLPAIDTDHLLLPYVEIETPTKIKWGPGIYCLNNQILKQSSLKIEIENLWQNWQEVKPLFENILEWWDVGKQRIKECCKNFSIQLKRDQAKTLLEKRNHLQELIRNNLPDSQNQIKEIRKEIEIIHYEQYEGSRIRAKIPKIDDEIPTKSFFNIEIKRAQQNAIKYIKNETGQTLTD